MKWIMSHKLEALILIVCISVLPLGVIAVRWQAERCEKSGGAIEIRRGAHPAMMATVCKVEKENEVEL